MSQRYKGAVISATPPTTTGGNSGTAPGIWTLQQQMQAQNGGVWPPQPINYVEDVFSTYLYTGTNSTRTITNGIDLSGNGGMVWLKSRNEANFGTIYDTARGPNTILFPSDISGNYSLASSLTAFTSSGFTLGNMENTNYSTTVTAASWTFRKQAKFFDVVTYTGNGANRTIAHNLGSVPGCIIVKRTDTTGAWQVYHRSLANTEYMVLNTTANKATGTTRWNSTTPTSTVFSLGTDTTVNDNGGTYIAYLFAHNAGGFGLTGAENVISCGSYTGGAGGIADINLGYEPQFVITKLASGTDPSGANDWYIVDNMRGWTVNASTGNATLSANTSSAEVNPSTVKYLTLNATGFKDTNCSSSSSTTYIYIAIRRGPMKTPTSGTSVFSPIAVNAPNSTQQTTNFPVDMQLFRYRSGADSSYAVDRLRGVTTSVSTSNSTPFLIPNATDAEGTFQVTNNWNNTGFAIPAGGWGNINNIFWSFRRAPSFMDVVCYTGTGVARTVNHNLGVAPELMIVKTRTQINSWAVYLGGPLGGTKTANLNQTYAAYDSSGHWNNTQPTASVFSIGNNGEVNDSGVTYVNYLFASCAGVSKVGSYSGTGTTKQIDCGFTGGARFVLIKRTDSTGDWYVWDSARGIVAGNDPYLLLNSTAAEVTNTDYVDTYSAGFEISSTAPAAINANGGTYIYLAIA